MLPAYAGMIRQLVGEPFEAVCAPRVCGDDPQYNEMATLIGTVLPAYAGMIRATKPSQANLTGAPRVCGDDPVSFSFLAVSSSCSPRMRG